MKSRGQGLAGVAAGALVIAQVAPLPVATPVGAMLGPSPALAQSQRTEIQCYAAQGQQNSCALPPGTRSVTYLGPDRSGICREGQTWRKRGNSLWVANGCGGMFEVTYAGAAPVARAGVDRAARALEARAGVAPAARAVAGSPAKSPAAAATSRPRPAG